MILKVNQSGVSGQISSIVRLRDVARIELGSQQYDQSCTLDGRPSVALSIYQLPGSNALQTAARRIRQDGGAEAAVPRGARLQHRLRHHAFHSRVDRRSLQDAARRGDPGGHRRAGLPAELAGGDHSVDCRAGGHYRHVRGDGGARLQLEQRFRCSGWCWPSASWSTTRSWWSRTWNAGWNKGQAPREAARKAMDEVTGPVVAVALVLCAVFVPVCVHRRASQASSSASSP